MNNSSPTGTIEAAPDNAVISLAAQSLHTCIVIKKLIESGFQNFRIARSFKNSSDIFIAFSELTSDFREFRPRRASRFTLLSDDTYLNNGPGMRQVNCSVPEFLTSRIGFRLKQSDIAGISAGYSAGKSKIIVIINAWAPDLLTWGMLASANLFIIQTLDLLIPH